MPSHPSTYGAIDKWHRKEEILKTLIADLINIIQGVPAYLVQSQEVLFVFQISKSPKKNVPKNKHFTVIGRKFKFQAQDSFLDYFFWDLKNESHFLKKATFSCRLYLPLFATKLKCFPLSTIVWKKVALVMSLMDVYSQSFADLSPLAASYTSLCLQQN